MISNGGQIGVWLCPCGCTLRFETGLDCLVVKLDVDHNCRLDPVFVNSLYIFDFSLSLHFKVL